MIFDTGPLVAAYDRRDRQHRACLPLLTLRGERRILPAPVTVEVSYFLNVRLGPAAFVGFLRQIETGALAVEPLIPADYRRIREVCEQYADSGIDFVDAAVLAVAERLNEPKVATLDRRHFSLMRPRHVAALALLPDLPA